MSNCTIPGCSKRAVAHGLCAKHYMRLRRRGDPNAEFPPGRQPKARPEDPETAALRRENAALLEEVAALKRRLDEGPGAARRHAWRKNRATTHWSAHSKKMKL
jgi:hypothetical protein